MRNPRKTNRQRYFTVLLTVLLMVSLTLTAVAADIPYKGYSYDEWDVAFPSQIGYLPVQVYYGDVDNKIVFSKPEDICVAENGDLYVLDSGNNRVVVLDRNYHLVKVLDTFINTDGSPYTLFSPTGIYMRGGDLYIADYENMTVVISDTNGNIRRLLQKPANGTFPQESEFRPQKVLCDSNGNVYVLVLGIYQGAVVFNAQGEFTGFYGNNTVQITARLLMDRFWKSIMNTDQQEQMSNYVPVQFTGFDISANDFMYTCTGVNVGVESELACVNPSGSNLWANAVTTGDLEIGYHKVHAYRTVFVDVAVAQDDFVFALDSTRGRIFMYDTEGNMIFAFGGKGSQKGTFTLPSAVETRDDEVLVLDKSKASLTVFRPTTYGQTVREALSLYIEGDYDGSKQLWEQVLVEDGNMYTAYIGIGKALLYDGQYKEAIEYFRRGRAYEYESRAFSEYRTQLLREAFPYLISGLCALVVIVAVCWYLLRRRQKKERGRNNHA